MFLTTQLFSQQCKMNPTWWCRKKFVGNKSQRKPIAMNSKAKSTKNLGIKDQEEVASTCFGRLLLILEGLNFGLLQFTDIQRISNLGYDDILVACLKRLKKRHPLAAAFLQLLHRSMANPMTEEQIKQVLKSQKDYEWNPVEFSFVRRALLALIANEFSSKIQLRDPRIRPLLLEITKKSPKIQVNMRAIRQSQKSPNAPLRIGNSVSHRSSLY